MLRPAIDADRDHVLRWRNHPEVRRVSLTRHEIGADEHARWWDAVAADDTREVLIYTRDDQPSGVVTIFDLDRTAGTAWWGYYLDNDGLTERGAMLPAWIAIQREAVRYAFDTLGLAELHGEVVGMNESARRFNQRNGFSEVGTQTRTIDGESVEVVHVVRTRA